MGVKHSQDVRRFAGGREGAAQRVDVIGDQVKELVVWVDLSEGYVSRANAQLKMSDGACEKNIEVIESVVDVTLHCFDIHAVFVRQY